MPLRLCKRPQCAACHSRFCQRRMVIRAHHPHQAGACARRASAAEASIAGIKQQAEEQVQKLRQDVHMAKLKIEGSHNFTVLDHPSSSRPLGNERLG